MFSFDDGQPWATNRCEAEGRLPACALSPPGNRAPCARMLRKITKQIHVSLANTVRAALNLNNKRARELTSKKRRSDQ